MEDLLNKLNELHKENPNAEIVADVGASMFSGYGTLKTVEFHADENIIELGFE